MDARHFRGSVVSGDDLLRIVIYELFGVGGVVKPSVVNAQ